MSVRGILTLVLAATAGGAGTAHALPEAPVKPAAPTAPREGDDPKLTEAQRRFHRGIELYKNGDFAGAQAEFTRAYELVPNYKILYNLGQVTYQRHDHAAALRYFRHYLADGIDQISAERRHEVSADIADLEQRIARLQIDTAEEGAEVFVDDVLVGKTPLRALIAVNGGPRKVDLVARTGEHRSRQVDVGSGEIVRVPFPRLTLIAPPPSAPRAAGASGVTATPASSQAVPSIVAMPSRKPSRTFPWKSWTLTGLLAGGAAATGYIALSAKRDLDNQLSRFPTDDIEVDYDKRRTHGFALATDGLLIGTAVMTAVSLYLTIRDPR
jgi:tetratricopeptide (TPR) repeat protein